jgi:hypothetical protein
VVAFLFYFCVGLLFAPIEPPSLFAAKLPWLLGSVIVAGLLAVASGRLYSLATGNPFRGSMLRMILYSLSLVTAVFGLIMIAQQFRP